MSIWLDEQETTCPECGATTDDLGEIWDNLHDSDWMYPNGYYEG